MKVTTTTIEQTVEFFDSFKEVYWADRVIGVNHPLYEEALRSEQERNNCVRFMHKFINFGAMVWLTVDSSDEFGDFINRHSLKLTQSAHYPDFHDVWIEHTLIGYAVIKMQDNHFLIAIKKGRVNVRYLLENETTKENP